MSLLEVDELVFSGNMRHEGLRMRSRDYVAIEEPLIGSFAVRHRSRANRRRRPWRWRIAARAELVREGHV